MKTFLQWVDGALSRVESLTDLLAALAMFSTMAIVGGEVVSRYFLNAPLQWSYDVLTLYVLPSLFFLGLPGSYSKKSHIAVDLLIDRLPDLAVSVILLIGRLGGMFLFACIVYFGVEHALEAYRSDESVPGVVTFLVWPSYALVPLGCALVWLRMLSELPANIISIAHGGSADDGPTRQQKDKVFYE